MRLSALGIFALTTTLATGACMPPTAEGGNGMTTPTTPGTPATPGTPTTPGTSTLGNGATYSGVYLADAPIDFTQNGVLPGLASPLLGALATIHDDPGNGIVNFAKDAGSSFINDLGSVGQGLLAGLITNAMSDLEDDYPQFDTITQMIQDIFEIAQTGVLNNKMTIHTPTASGVIQIDLALGGMTFTLLGNTISTLTPSADVTTATTGMTGLLVPRADAPIADADITFSGGSLAIPVGGYLLEALGPLLFEPEFGTKDLASTLQSLVPCEAIAQDVSDAAQGNEVLEYVVTPDLVNAACQAAVTYAATEVTNAINKLQVSGVTITNGQATLYDVSQSKPTADHISDHIGDGTWIWNFGSIGVPSTLNGDRVGTAY